MLEKKTKEFFDRLEKDKGLRDRIREGLENVAKDAGFDVTEDELNAELRKLWGATKGKQIVYSEPPSF
jgi:hypothetical protein